MGRKFSGLELTLIALFTVVTVIACVLIGLLATGEPGVKSPDFFPQCQDTPVAQRIDCIPDELATQAPSLPQEEAEPCRRSHADHLNL
ncbi:hypothetical protein EK904_012364 [Melospiza melodia maxima]|nr:hypothetical protein EK904_012364 [Melospiza melodia maxima]